MEGSLATDFFAIVAGTTAFGSTLALSTWTQQRLLHVSTGSPFGIPTLLGMMTVCLASQAAHTVALNTQEYIVTTQRKRQYPYFSVENAEEFLEYKRRSRSLAWSSQYRRDEIDMKFFKVSAHTLRIWAMGLLAFKLLGGRFWTIAPSSYTNLGSYARTRLSLPATASYATSAQRAQLERLGRRVGCHTCGSRQLWNTGDGSFRFVGDHMPPKSVADRINQRWYRRLVGLRSVKFRFYPQCVDCSHQQGRRLAQATHALRRRRHTHFSWGGLKGVDPVQFLWGSGGGRHAYNHGLQPRFHHGAGVGVSAAAVVGTTAADWMDQNRYRYAHYQEELQHWLAREVRKFEKQWIAPTKKNSKQKRRHVRKPSGGKH